VDDTGATIRCQRSKFTFLTLPSSGFPTMPDSSEQAGTPDMTQVRT